MGGRRDGALVTAGVAGRIRVIGVDVSGFVLDAFFSIRAVSIRAFVPVVRAVLAPIAVAVLMGGRRDRALVAAGVAGRIRVIGVDVCSLVIDAFFPIRAVIVGALVPVVRAVPAPIAVAVLMGGWRVLPQRLDCDVSGDGHRGVHRILRTVYLPCLELLIFGRNKLALRQIILAAVQYLLGGHCGGDLLWQILRLGAAVSVKSDGMVPPVYSDCRRSLISRVVSCDHGIFRSRVIVAAIRRGETIGGAVLRHIGDGHGLDAGGRLSRCSRVAHGEGVRAGLSIDGILDGVALTVLQTLQHRRLRVRSHHMAAHSAELLLIAPVAGNVFGVLFGVFRGGVSCAAVHAGPDVAAVPVHPAKFMATCAFLAAQLQLADHSAVIVGIWQAQPLQVHAPIFVGDKKLRCGAPVLLIRFLVVAPLPPCRAQPHGLPVRGSDFDVLFYNHCKFLILHHCHVVRPVRASSDRGCRQLCITVVLIKRKGQRSQRCVLDQNVPAVAVHAAADARAQVALRPHHAASDGNVIARTASSATDSCAGIVTPSFDRSTGNLDMMRIFRLVLSVLIAAAYSCSA